MDCCVSITVRIIGSFATSLASGAGLLRQTSKYSARPRRSSSNANPAGMMRHPPLLATARICGAEESAKRRHPNDEKPKGRASCRERVCQYGKIALGEVPLKKQHQH